MFSMDVPSEWDENNIVLLHPKSYYSGWRMGTQDDELTPQLPAVQLGFVSDQPRCPPNGDVTLHCFLGSDLELPGVATLSNICLVPSGWLRVAPCDLLGQNLECDVSAQSTAPITTRNEDWRALAYLRSCVWIRKTHDQNQVFISSRLWYPT